MPASADFHFNFGPAGSAREADEPMRLLVMADFSGRPPAERPPLATRPILRVDLDTLDAVIARLAPQIQTPAGEVAIDSLDDFHPDALFQKLELFRALREARAQPPSANQESPLAALLGGGPKQGAAVQGKTEKQGLDALIHRVVAPHIVADTAAQSQAYFKAVDLAIAEQMRAVLHAPAFQSMEAAWRGVQWLVSRLELDENLQVHLFDVSQEELMADVDTAADGDLARTAIYAALVHRKSTQSGGKGWSALIGLYSFGPGDSDVRLLTALGAVASHVGAPFLAGADASVWRSAEDTDQARPSWNALRTSAAARWIGLAAPRLLLRGPYGPRNEPVEAFAFDELGNTPAHEHYLWASGALALALLLGRSYTLNEGWSFSPGDEREVDDLPACTQPDRDGEPELVPCAEYFLADHEADRLLSAGLMPLLSHRHRNVALLMRFQSIAQPAAPLQGLPV